MDMRGLLLLVIIPVTFISGIVVETDSDTILTGRFIMVAAAGGFNIASFPDKIDAAGFIGNVDSIAITL